MSLNRNNNLNFESASCAEVSPSTFHKVRRRKRTRRKHSTSVDAKNISFQFRMETEDATSIPRSIQPISYCKGVYVQGVCVWDSYKKANKKKLFGIQLELKIILVLNRLMQILNLWDDLLNYW